MSRGTQSSGGRLALLIVGALLVILVAAGTMAYRVLRLSREGAGQATATVDEMLRERARLRQQVARLKRLSAEQDRVLQQETRRLRELERQGPGATPESQPIDPRAAAAVMLENAAEELAAGRYHNARELARNSLALAPRQPRALQIMGLAACHLDDADTARKAYLGLGPKQRARLQEQCRKVGRVKLADVEGR